MPQDYGDRAGRTLTQVNPRRPRHFSTGNGSLVGARTPHGLDLTDADQRNDYLMDAIPGLGAMRDKFK